MELQNKVIEEAQRLFPDSISDVDAVGEYASKVFNELIGLDKRDSEYSVKSGLYTYLRRLRDHLHLNKMKAVSSIVANN